MRSAAFTTARPWVSQVWPGLAVPAGWLARLPGCCAACQAWGAQRVCTDCQQRFAAPRPRCRWCALPVVAGVEVCGTCLIDPPPFDAAWAAVDYAFPWSTLLPRFKFRQGLDLAGAFVDLMVAAPGPGSSPLLHPASPMNGGARPGPSTDRILGMPDVTGLAPVLLPVPLSPARLRQRGYNQAWELARRLARRRGWAAWPTALLKRRESAEQMSLQLSDRAANVHRAFAVSPRHLAALAGRAVVLVDDVMTSGATLREITRLLLEDTEVASVEVWVLARTPPFGHRP